MFLTKTVSFMIYERSEKEVGKGPIKIWSMDSGVVADDDDAECAMKFKWAWL